MSRVWAALALLAATLPSGAHAGDFSKAAVATTVGQFLTLGAGGRAEGMGQAQAAATEGAEALYWNPAALTGVRTMAATFMHAPYIASSFYDYGAFAKNLGPYGAFGLGVQYFSSGSIPETDQIGTPLGTFTSYDMALSAGYAYKFGGYSVGGSVKMVRSTIIDTAHTAAMDLGVLSPICLDRKLNFAFTATNLFGTLNYEKGIQSAESLPLAFRLGSAYRITPRWLMALDLELPRGNEPLFALGTEYWLVSDKRWGAAWRMGYNSITSSDITGFTGASFGVGIKWDRWITDYAVVPYGGLGITHRISLSYKL